MEALQFNGLPENIHHCTSSREGDWIVWRCPQCDNYERRYNRVTGTMSIRRGNSAAQHMGMSTRDQNMEALQQVVSFN